MEIKEKEFHGIHYVPIVGTDYLEQNERIMAHVNSMTIPETRAAIAETDEPYLLELLGMKICDATNEEMTEPTFKEMFWCDRGALFLGEKTCNWALKIKWEVSWQDWTGERHVKQYTDSDAAKDFTTELLNSAFTHVSISVCPF